MDKRAQAMIDDAVYRFRQEGGRGVDWVLIQTDKAIKDAFDAFLVSVSHPLAFQPGTQESRIRAYVAKESGVYDHVRGS